MQNSIASVLRNEVGTNASHRSREAGFIPGVIYSKNINPLPVQVERKYLEGLLRNQGQNTLVTLSVGNSSYTTFIKEIQRHPVTKEIIHLDFQQVEKNEDIYITIPVVLRGKNHVEKSGVVVQQQLKEVEIKCMSSNIPQKLEFDISSFDIGESLRVSDLEVSEEISIVTDPQSIIASIATLRQEVENSEES